MTGRIDLPAEPRILVVALRRLGDVLLTTPLVRSLRRAWPQARVDMLVFADTAPILAGNPDIDAVIPHPQRPSRAETLHIARRLWRRYDLAVSTQAGDRPSFFACIAGRRRAGPVERNVNGRIKALLLGRSAAARPDLHRVEETLQLAGALGIEPVGEIVAPRSAARPSAQPDARYAVLHAAPFFRYKQWHPEGWRAVARHLAGRGLRIVATGGPAAGERAYLDRIWDEAGVPVQRLDGALDWPEIGSLLADADVFVGPDTSVTHLAAAAGCPTVAIYGPTDPARWGPWPAGGLPRPWASAGSVQRRGNVWLVQNPLPCMPCRLEGCLRNVTSHSLCLDQMTSDPVIGAVDEALAEAAAAEGGAVAKRRLFNP